MILLKKLKFIDESFAKSGEKLILAEELVKTVSEEIGIKSFKNGMSSDVTEDSEPKNISENNQDTNNNNNNKE